MISESRAVFRTCKLDSSKTKWSTISTVPERLRHTHTHTPYTSCHQVCVEVISKSLTTNESITMYYDDSAAADRRTRSHKFRS